MDGNNIFLSLCAVIFTFGEVWSLEKPKGIEDEDEGLEAALIGEYGRLHAQGKQTSYMEMASLICGKIIKACAPMRPIENMKDEDGSITYDPETEGFKINPGKKVRVAGSSSSNDSKKEPVKQSKPDSIPVRQAHNHEEL
ncbi:hypothetical protein MAR_028660 [Mya arenaria]|uniref:Secreted protein n=1 Tax=Mya arenaria TaxID=6604 RepID=A0ABY7DGZ8_MYAAR|nr:hypothetical protein MAR_028660 [Mya arenaria]